MMEPLLEEQEEFEFCCYINSCIRRIIYQKTNIYSKEMIRYMNKKFKVEEHEIIAVIIRFDQCIIYDWDFLKEQSRLFIGDQRFNEYLRKNMNSLIDEAIEFSREVLVADIGNELEIDDESFTEVINKFILNEQNIEKLRNYCNEIFSYIIG